MWTYLAVAVVVIILLVLVYGSNWKTYPGTSYTRGAKSTNQGNFRDLGSANTAEECQALCADGDWCNAYTFTNESDVDKSCVGIKNLESISPTTGGAYTSGQRITGYGPKLMHNFGMGDAGAKEKFSNVRAPATGLELFSNVRAPATGLELFSNVRAPATGIELYRTGAPRTRIELFDAQNNDKRAAMAAPQTRIELFGVQQPGKGTFYSQYMYPKSMPFSTQLPSLL